MEFRDPFNIPILSLKPERSRSFEAGFQQDFLHDKYELTGTYFNNLFHDQINYVTVDPGEFRRRIRQREPGFRPRRGIGVAGETAAAAAAEHGLHVYVVAIFWTIPRRSIRLYNPGQPLLRRPKHSATALLSYMGTRWGANLGGSFVGRRPDSDFLGFGIDHAAGYVRVDVGGWYAVRPRVTVYANVENALDRRYNEVVGYPALPINFRAGVRFRIGGE